jgi:glycosyltransferase involved in cell wall biosynthesis
MHVLVLPSWYSTPEVPWSGIFFENQALALARGGARVGVAFVEPRGLRNLSPANLRESHFQLVSSEDRGVTFLRMKGWNTIMQTAAGAKIWAALSNRLVAHYVRRFGVPDIIHAQAALWAGRVALRLAQTLARPCVVTEHSSAVMRGDLKPGERREVARIYRQADAVLAVSRALQEAVDGLAGRQRGPMVPNAVDFEFFNLPAAPRRQEPFTYLCVCNLVTNKQVDRLIGAFARASLRSPGSRLVIVGDGPEIHRLRRLAGQSVVARQVEFAGGLPPEGVRARLWTSNALVLPSAFETFGVVLVEALATGIPVISTRCGGPEDIIEPGLGLLVDRDDDGALAEAMVAVTTRTYSEDELRGRAMARFSFESVARMLLGIYRGLGDARQLRGYHDALQQPSEGPFHA